MRLILFLLFFLFSFSFTKDVVITSIKPVYLLTKEIVPPQITVRTLISEKVDFHFHELKFSQLKELKRAKVILITGIPVGGWERKLKEIFKEKVREITDRREDPHFWMSPKRALKVSENIYKVLIYEFPEYKEEIQKRWKFFKRRLLSLEKNYRKVLINCKERRLVSVHPFLNALGIDYNFTVISLENSHSHGDMSPKKMATFLKQLRSRGMDFVFSIKGEETPFEKLLKERYGVKVYPLDVKMRGDSYIKIMEENLSTLRKALRCL